MKKLFLMVLLLAGMSFAQYHQNGWGIGAGINSVRFMTDLVAEPLTFGGHILVQRDIDPNVGFRLGLDYNHFYGRNYYKATIDEITTDQLNISLSFMYRFFVDQPVVPYVGAGMSTMQYTNKNNTLKTERSSFGELGADLFFGAYFNWLPENWLLKAELSQHTTSTDQFDMVAAPDGGGLFGGSIDSYIGFHIGAMYYWDRTPAPKVTELPAGIDYNKIEDISKKYAAKEPVDCCKPMDEKMNKLLSEIEELKAQLKNMPSGTTTIIQEKGDKKEAFLRTVYFKTGTTELESDSFEGLMNNFIILNSNSSLNVALEGYTDSQGDNPSNKTLSIKRAEFVKTFLVNKGIDASRITTAGFAAEKPVMDNSTETGRKLNRRVEFKVK